MMKIKLTSLMVDDQQRALEFYTRVLGFRVKHDLPAGPYRWITVVAAEGREDLELVLEPNVNPAGRAFQEAMFSQNVPLAAFEVDDIDAEVARLKAADVVFGQDVTAVGPVRIARFADTCGNWLQLYQPGS